MEAFVYNAEAQLNDGSAILLDLEARGWADKDLLAATRRFTLLPKEGMTTLRGQPYPIVTVAIPEGGKAVFKSRVYGVVGVNEGAEGVPYFRAYAIGYKLGKHTHWTWVLPTGDIENGEDPWLADLLLTHMKSTAAGVEQSA